MRPDVDVPRAVLAALAIAVAAAFLFAGVTSGVAFDAFNPAWDGTSELRSTAEDAGSEPVVVQETGDYDAYGANDVAFVLAPDREYDDRDAARVRGFVARGGTLVVADRDGPHGHALLDDVGAGARPNGTVLRDEQRYHRTPAFPVADNVSEHQLVAGVESVTLNHGTAVDADGAAVLVASSPNAYLDVDESESISGGEVLRTHPVATVEPVGDGRVVVVGDPSVFINVMQAQTDNDAFTRALVDDTDHTLVDVSHASSPPPLVSAVLAVRDSAALQLGVGLGLLAAVALGARVAGRRRDRESPGPARPDDVAAGYERLYADLDADTVRRLTKGVIPRRSEPRDDD